MRFALCLLLLTFTFTPQDSTGTVYIYRVEEAAKMESKKASVYLDGKHILSMPESEFIGLKLKPGEYVFKMKSKASATPLKVEAGKVYYIRASQTAPFNYIQNMYKVEADQALLHMNDFKALEDKNIKDKSLLLVRDKP